MLTASMDGCCQADDIHPAAVPVGGSKLEHPVAIWPLQCLDGCLPLLGGCVLELVPSHLYRAQCCMDLSQDQGDAAAAAALGHPEQCCWGVAISHGYAHKLEGGL